MFLLEGYSSNFHVEKVLLESRFFADTNIAKMGVFTSKIRKTLTSTSFFLY